MVHLQGEPSYWRFRFGAQAVADIQAARLSGYHDFDLDRSIMWVVEVSHTMGRDTPVVTANGSVARATSTAVLPLDCRGRAPDCSVEYVVTNCPTRYYIRRAYFGDCGAVLASYAVISAYS